VLSLYLLPECIHRFVRFHPQVYNTCRAYILYCVHFVLSQKSTKIPPRNSNKQDYRIYRLISKINISRYACKYSQAVYRPVVNLCYRDGYHLDAQQTRDLDTKSDSLPIISLENIENTFFSRLLRDLLQSASLRYTFTSEDHVWDTTKGYPPQTRSVYGSTTRHRREPNNAVERFHSELRNGINTSR